MVRIFIIFYLFIMGMIIICPQSKAQTFLDKKCADLSKEIENRQQAIVDQQAYVAELQNDYAECSNDKQTVADALAVLDDAKLNAKQASNWSDLNAISDPVVTP